MLGRGLRDTGPIAGLNPGGANFTPDGRLLVGMRTTRSIMAFATSLDQAGHSATRRGALSARRGIICHRCRGLNSLLRAAPIEGNRWTASHGLGGCNGTEIDSCSTAISTYRLRPSKPQALPLPQRLLLYVRFVLSRLRLCGNALPICIRIAAPMSPLPANRHDPFL
jgi:hypothetical protein